MDVQSTAQKIKKAEEQLCTTGIEPGSHTSGLLTSMNATIAPVQKIVG